MNSEDILWHVNFQIDWEQTQQMRRLEEHISEGGTIRSFLYPGNGSTPEAGICDLIQTLRKTKTVLEDLSKPKKKFWYRKK